MKRFLKSRKALSPVVAAIILIAVTVAVSIAVAAWMGALTFTFMQTEELAFTGYTWDSSSTKYWIRITVKNTGSSDMTISGVRVNDVDADDWGYTPTYSLAAGNSVTFNVTRSGGAEYTSGTKYEFTVITAKGNMFGPYIKTAP
ncbi:MAG: fibronectin type III domain-containing protein [Candidatus Bathyarchaeota archaeon]|nr:fibronectin type III domain-containing protein [Candidatus Bathyarchaeota archaeon]